MPTKLDFNINEQEFRNLVAELPEQNREIVLLYFLDNLTKKAIAKKMNLSYGIARNRLSKGIYLLKKISVKEKNTELLLS
jgi:RNA polymerase sigma factor (sigma-70 family)